MIVGLTKGQYQGILQVVRAPVREALLREVYDLAEGETVQELLLKGGRWTNRRVRVRAPYVAWLEARDVLLSRAFRENGARNKEIPDRLNRALQALQIGLNAHDRHPAFRGYAVMGRQFESFPAWSNDHPSAGKVHAGAPIWLPAPTMAAKFTILRPDTFLVKGQPVTRWLPSDASANGDWICQESTHLSLWGDAWAIPGDPHVDADRSNE